MNCPFQADMTMKTAVPAAVPSVSIDMLPVLEVESVASRTLGYLKAVSAAVRRQGPRLRLVQADGSSKILLGEAQFGHAWRLHSRNLIKEVDDEAAPAALARLILDNNLTTAREGAEWEAMREMVAPMMRYKMRSYSQAVDEATADLIQGLAQAGPETESLWTLCARWAAHTVCLPVLGIGFGGETVLNLVNSLRECMFHLVRQSQQYGSNGLRQDPQLVRLRAEMEAIVTDAMTLSKPGDETMVAMLLARAGYPGGKPEERLVRELQPALVGALAASVHNNSLALYWTLMRLAQNPAAAIGIQQEFCAQTPGADQHLNHTPVALAAVREALRLSPVLPFIERKATQDMVLCGVFIPEGTIVVFSPWVVHRDENVWPDALRFDLHRFTDADRLDMTKWFPFGLGHRACIGSNLALNQIVRAISLTCSQLSLSMPENPKAAHWRPTLRVLLEPQEDGGRLVSSSLSAARNTTNFNKPEKRYEALFC